MASRHVLLEQWSKGIAELATSLGQAEFSAHLLEAVGRLAAFDFIMAFAYRGAERPAVLANTLDAARHQVIATDYASGPFLLDPFYQLVQRGQTSGCHRLRDIAPDHFRRSEYFRVHYHRTGIGEEVGFAFPLAHGFTGVTSLARWATSPHLTQGEMGVLAAIAPAIGALCRLHWDRDRNVNSTRPHSPREVSHLGLRLLSAREREIVTLILQGHSTESVALQLDISPGTVKIHRKNIYRKLKVSTQAELFAAFLGFAAASTAHGAYSQGDIPQARDLTHARSK